MGATASAVTTLGRNRVQSLPASTSDSAPSTSIFKKSMVSGACLAHNAASVVTATGIARAGLPNSCWAAVALLSIVVERPWKCATR